MRVPRCKGRAKSTGVSDATIHSWRGKYGGMEVSDAKRLNALEEEIGMWPIRRLMSRRQRMWSAASGDRVGTA
jgi:hypothetical protein